uniref:hypothetical protein n=1 Tax=Pseudomonas taiwanensis TaxID=470150 RepID=UPI0015B8A3BD|nr:hypothetical protein [Pseudomonas taiwanensis]NWL76478.1 hypothetical protein [Pseudomonas taiwanensis]
MRLAPLIPLLFLLGTGSALAEACHVMTRSSSSAVPAVEMESCYEFTGVPESTIDWSCSNESKEMLSSQKHPVERCADGSDGQCIAALTQESLANPRSGAENESQARPAIPNDAKVITYYYSVANLGQARTDCENSGGTWREQ